jgi:mRNA-degrading endonuclease RelE of RelBE toxin-antitoxin system
MEKNNLEIIWLKHCIKDFKNLNEEEFIAVNSKLKKMLPNLIQNTSQVKGTNLRRLRMGSKRLFLKIINNDVYCVGYKMRNNAYNKKQLQEMDKLMRKIIGGQGL